MAKTFITSGTGASQTLDAIQNEKVPVYNTRAAAEADLANIEEGGIVATKDTGATERVVDVVQDGNMNPVTSNAVYDAFTVRGAYYERSNGRLFLNITPTEEAGFDAGTLQLELSPGHIYLTDYSTTPITKFTIL